MIDSDSEKVFLVDENGTISCDDITMRVNKDKNVVIAVPVNATSVIDKLAQQFGAKVKRTANSSKNVMACAKDLEIVLISHRQYNGNDI